MAARTARSGADQGRGPAARHYLRRCVRPGAAAARHLGCRARATGALAHSPPERNRGLGGTERTGRYRRAPGAPADQQRLGRCGAAAAHARIERRSTRGIARGGPCPDGRGPADRAGLPAAEPVGIARGRLPGGVSARAAPYAVGLTGARLARTAQLRDRQPARLPVPHAARPSRQHRRGEPGHAAPALVLPLAVGRLPDQGAQARLHADADPPAAARATTGVRWTGGAQCVSGTVDIYTDGACRGNPGPGGWAAVLSAGGREKEISGAQPLTTNNRMELQAVIEALSALKRPLQVRLYTDSQYVRRGILEWLAQWKARGWKTADRKPVKNQDLWQQLETAAARHRIEWHWVPGHAGVPGNERCDALANAAIDA